MRILPLLLLLIVVSCSIKETEDYKSVVSDNVYLEEAIKKRDAELGAITGSMNQIETNLAAIRKNEGLIADMKGSKDPKKLDQINAMITEIGSYMNDNRKIAADLEVRLKEAVTQNEGLSKLVRRQKLTMLEKESEIQKLKTTVHTLKNQLDSTVIAKDEEIRKRDVELENKQKLLAEKDNVLNSAFYQFGSKKELTDKMIIKPEKGSKKNFRLAEQLDKNQFKSVNINSNLEFELGPVDNPKMISSHPTSSYYFLRTEKQTLLKVSDPEKFWSLSRYLVVVTDN